LQAKISEWVISGSTYTTLPEFMKSGRSAQVEALTESQQRNRQIYELYYIKPNINYKKE
jgi:hypothetical protein